MPLEKKLELWGLIFGVAASILLSFNLNKLIKAILLGLYSHDTTLLYYFDGQTPPVFKGIDEHLARGMKANKQLSLAGFVLLAISFALQIIAIIV